MIVSRWINKFNTGIYIIGDGLRVGRPKISVIKNHAAAVKTLVDEYGRYTVEEITNSILGITEGSIHKILTNSSGT